MAYCEVDSALWCDVDGLVVDDASVADACRVLAWRAVFDGFDEDFYGVFARAEVDDFECCFDDVGGFGFFAAVFAWSHESVYEAFDDVDVCFSEALVFVASHAVRCCHGCQV